MRLLADLFDTNEASQNPLFWPKLVSRRECSSGELEFLNGEICARAHVTD